MPAVTRPSFLMNCTFLQQDDITKSENSQNGTTNTRDGRGEGKKRAERRRSTRSNTKTAGSKAAETSGEANRENRADPPDRLRLDRGDPLHDARCEVDLQRVQPVVRRRVVRSHAAHLRGEHNQRKSVKPQL